MVKNRSELKHRDIYLNQLVEFQKIVLTLHKLIDDDIDIYTLSEFNSMALHTTND